MRNFIFWTLLSSFSICLNTAVAQNWVYSNYIEGDIIMPFQSTVDENDNLIILSRIKGNVTVDGDNINTYNNSFDYLLTKYDNSGNIIWYKHIGTNSNEQINGGVATDQNGNVYLIISATGVLNYEATNIDLGSDFDILQIKYNSLGAFQNNTILSSNVNDEKVNAILLLAEDNLIISGSYTAAATILGNTINSDTLAYGVFLTNIVNGSVNWINNNICSGLSTIKDIQNFNGNFYIGIELIDKIYLDVKGTKTMAKSADSKSDGLLYKFNPSSQQGQWIRKVSGTGFDNFISIEIDNFENVFALYNTSSTTVTIDSTSVLKTTINKTGDFDALFVKYNRDGTLLTKILKGGNSSDAYKDFAISDNILFATGIFEDQIIFNEDTLNSQFGYSGFLSAFNTEDDPLSGLGVYGSNADVSIAQLQVDNQGRAIIIGYYLSSQLQIGLTTYPNTLNERNLFFAAYSHPFNATFTHHKNISCNGGNDGELTVTPYFGIGPYTFNWSGGITDTDSVVTGIAAGIYSVTVTDRRDSVAVATIDLTQPTALQKSFTQRNLTCFKSNDGEIDITITGGSAPYSYLWSGGSGLNPTDQDQDGLSAAEYTLTVTDAKNCQIFETVTITQPGEIRFNPTITNESAPDTDDGSIVLNPFGGTSPYGYNWSGPSLTPPVTTKDISGLGKGAYTVTITDDSLCMADTSISITDPGFNAYVAQKLDVTCKGQANGSINLAVNPSGGLYSYNWENSLGQTIGTNRIISGLSGGTYYVTVYDLATNPVDSISTYAIVNEPANALTHTTFPPINPRCYGDANGLISVQVSGGTPPYSYLWSTGAITEDLVNIPVNPAGYKLTITDNNGCMRTDSVFLTQNPPLSVTYSIENPLCKNTLTGIAEVSVTGGTEPFYSYRWNDPGNQTEAIATDLADGTYTVTITDDYDCEITQQVTLIDPTDVAIEQLIPYNPSCYKMNDGAIKAIVTGGWDNYTFNWSNGVNGTDSIANLAPDTYSVTVEDINDCGPVLGNITLTEPDSLKIDSYVKTDESFTGANDGSITISASGGNSPLLYSLNDVDYQLSDQFTDLSPQTYTIYVNDDKNCGPVSLPGIVISQYTSIYSHRLGQISVYPVPASDVVHIQLPKLNQKVVVEIYDVTGSLIHSSVYQNSILLKIDVSDYPSGLYHLQLDQMSAGSFIKN